MISGTSSEDLASEIQQAAIQRASIDIILMSLVAKPNTTAMPGKHFGFKPNRNGDPKN